MNFTESRRSGDSGHVMKDQVSTKPIVSRSAYQNVSNPYCRVDFQEFVFPSRKSVPRVDVQSDISPLANKLRWANHGIVIEQWPGRMIIPTRVTSVDHSHSSHKCNFADVSW